MSMFDYLRCDYPLSAGPTVQGLVFQTRSFNELMDTIHIRADGTLWGEDYEIEDHSDPNAVGVARLAGMMTRVNVRPKRLDDFSGTVEFYGNYGPRNKRERRKGWVRFEAQFTAGCLVSVELMEHEIPPEVMAAEQAQALQAHVPGASRDTTKRRF